MNVPEVPFPVPSFSIRGKRILVVGGSRGLGHGIVQGLEESGADVLCLARSEPDNLIPGVTYVGGDVSKDNGLSEALSLINNWGGCDGLVFAAGVSLGRDTASGEAERFRKTLETNLHGAFRAVSSFSPLLNAGASVVLISSINAQLAFSDNPGYVASKSGLNGLGRSLAMDLASREVRVNSLSLGYFPTDMTSESFADPTLREVRAERAILKRWGRIEEVVGPTVFLLSDASSFVTGQDINVDGGWSVAGI